MDFGEMDARGLILLGCGKMGGAMLEGWLAGGLSPRAVSVIDPLPSNWLKGTRVAVNAELPKAPAMIATNNGTQRRAAAILSGW